MGRRAAVQAASRRKWRGPDSGGCRREWPSDVFGDTTHRHVRVWVLVRGGRGFTCGAHMRMGAHELTGLGTSEHVRKGTG
jgi:hypothetical protein